MKSADTDKDTFVKFRDVIQQHQLSIWVAIIKINNRNLVRADIRKFSYEDGRISTMCALHNTSDILMHLKA